MKKKLFFVAMSSVQMLLLCVAFAFVSCGSDDHESVGSQVQSGETGGSQTQSGQKASKNTWYLAESDLSSYVSEINAAYNKDASSYYNYVSNEGACLGTSYGIEIINENTLKIWQFYYGVLGCKESLDSEYYVPTNYTIGSDKIIFYAKNSTMYTYVETEGKIIVTNGDIYTITPQGLVKDGSSNALKKKEVYEVNFEKETKITNDCKKQVSYREERNVSECTYKVVFNSSLASLYPNEKFVYGIKYGTRGQYVKETESKSGTIEIELSMLSSDSREAYDSAKKYIEEYEKGVGIPTLSERQAYQDALKMVALFQSVAFNDVEGATFYVRYGGVRYYLD